MSDASTADLDAEIAAIVERRYVDGYAEIRSPGSVALILALEAAIGHATTVLWIFPLLMVALSAGPGGMNYSRDGLIFGLSPLGLGVAFLARGRAGDAAFSVLAGLSIYYAYRMVISANRASLRLQAERDRAQAALRHLALEAERRRIAHDLHDGIGADIVALLYELRSVAAGSAVQGALGPVVERTAALLSELRAVVQPLQRAEASLESLATELEGRCAPLVPPGSSFAVERPSTPAGTPIAGEVQDAVLRIGQELTRNSAQHSGATRVRVRLGVAEGTVELEVADDGVGLDEATFQASGGGIANARERARALSGTLSLLGAERGTRLVARLPSHRDP